MNQSILIQSKAAVEIMPSASTLVIKALNEPPRDRKKEKNIKHSGNLEFEAVVEIAKKMRFKSMVSSGSI